MAEEQIFRNEPAGSASKEVNFSYLSFLRSIHCGSFIGNISSSIAKAVVYTEQSRY